MFELISRVCGACIPQRYVLSLMGFLCLLNMFTIRVSLNVAIVEMVNETLSLNVNQSYVDPDTCPDSDPQTSIALRWTFNDTWPTSGDPDAPEKISEEPMCKEQFEWDEQTQGLLLSSFYWGYILTQMPGGLLADRFGGKHTLNCGLFVSAVATALSPMAVRLADWYGMLVTRIIAGAGQGLVFPALNVLLAQWVPVQERGKLGALVLSGSNLGTVAGTAASGVLIELTGQWDMVFYCFAGVAILWSFFWSILIFERPSDHPYLSQSEQKYLNETIGESSKKRASRIPWRAILTSVPLWGLVTRTVGHDWGFFTMIADLPKYMKSVLKFRIAENGFLSALPYLAMWICSLFFGCLADFLISSKRMSITNVRKLLTTIASFGPAAGIIGASYAGCDRVSVVILFTVGMGMMGAYYSGTRVNALDLSPNYAGTLMAIVNTIGAVSGIATPYLIGVLIPNSTAMQEWRLVFWITVVVLIVTNFAFVFMASGDVQPWNEPSEKPGDPDHESSEKNEKPKKLSDNKVGNTLEIGLVTTSPGKRSRLDVQPETFRYLPES